MSDADPEPIDTTDAEDAQILLADPDDYHRTQRLKQIHKARERVADHVHDLDVKGRGKVSWESITELVHAVAVYAEEILALRKQMDQGPLELPEGCQHDTVEDYAITMGNTQASDGTNQPVAPNHAMAVYRTCNDFLAEVKPLIEEDDTDEWEV
jgi:hypothetical protein